MKLLLRVAANDCAGGSCPSVYLGDDGQYYIQGYQLKASERSALDIPRNEDVVRVPSEFVEALAKMAK